ncbi:HD domain-containing protein [Aquincola sp. S2]|uniref:HD domain-containing protein n=1 Tax=Pseudaquabacterium terrae TaxID=2732868 RepID=A0ABX2EM03_9BURK|nr:HD domain-containing protein [Aquabacterium terrae]NRF69678.1 HD domain-containing protein [Aquabacterium terrae]
MNRSVPEFGGDVIERIAELYRQHGSRPYDGGRRESVTALEHALQCAQLAEWAGAEPSLVAAALLHDIGDFVGDGSDGADNHHELRAQDVIGDGFGAEVLDPIRLHVAAKRYLVSTEPGYADALSPASQLSLALQGGPMSSDEVQRFEEEAYAPQALLLRRWDDAAKTPGKPTPSLDYYLVLLQELREQARPARRRTVVGALDA